MTKEDIHFNLTYFDGLFGIKLIIYCKKRCDINQCIQDEIHWNAMQLVFQKLKIFSTHLLRRMELKKMEPQYINSLGKWKPYTQDECYPANMPINTTNMMSGASGNHKVLYNTRTIMKYPEEHQRLISHSLSDARFNSMMYMILIQVQHLMIFLTSFR